METSETFGTFGGLRLDVPLDEVGPEAASFLRDVDWDGSLGKVRSRDGFQKLKAADATGPYKALFPHSALRLLATKRVSAESVKVVAVDREGTEKVEATWPSTAAKSTFTHFGIPSASYTFGRANVSTAKPVRFDGTTFTEPTATVDGVAGKEMPRGALMTAWAAGGNRLVVANTAATGGPNGAASSVSHVWFSKAGAPEEWESTAYSQLSVGDGEEITALCVFSGRVFVFKETRLFVFYSVSLSEESKPEFNFNEFSLGEGSRMKRATGELLAETSDQLAVATASGVYFCTTDGVYVTTGGEPSKISQNLHPLEETTPFEGPMAEFLNGSNETFRWPATGIASVGKRLFVRRYEFMFTYDIETGAWGCWKMPAVSMAVWTGLSGGGSEAAGGIPGTAVNRTGVGTVAWSSVSSAKARDGSYAICNLPKGSTSNYLEVSNFGFSIPAGATITGIKAVIYRKSFFDPRDSEVRLVKAGVVEGVNKALAGAWPGFSSEANPAAEYGGSEDLWGLSLTPANVNATTFGIVFSAKNSGTTGEAEVDVIALTVYFALAEAASGVRPRLFCTQSKSVFWTGPYAEEQSSYRQPEWQPGFYNLGSSDEKTLVTTKLIGSGNVNFQVATDYAALGEATVVQMGTAPAIKVAQFNKAQSGTYFSHRISGTAPWSLQTIVRYLQVTEPPTTKAT